MTDIIANFPFIQKQVCLQKDKLLQQDFINKEEDLKQCFIFYALSQALKNTNFQQLINNIYILSNGKFVENIDEKFLKNTNNVTFNIQLKGGKGAFGAEMKKQANKKDKITNWDNSRDLHGRRIINQTMEEKLISYYKKKKEEDKMVNEALQKYKIEQATIKQGSEQLKIKQEYKDKIDKIENNMASTVLSGMKKYNSLNNKSEQKTQQANQKQENQIQENLQQQQEEEIKENLQSSQEETKEDLKKESSNESLQSKPDLEDNLTKKIKTEQDQKLVEDIEEQPEKPKFDEIDLKQIQSLDQLNNDFNDEHLKAELQRLGVKAGGLKKDRAKRLWDIKQDPSKLFHPKYLAKK